MRTSSDRDKPGNDASAAVAPAADGPVGESGLIPWLLRGDPAIAWQALRDLVPGADPARIAAERARISREGWGARLMAARDPATGLWGGGLYVPKWISTHYTLLDLTTLGINPDDPGNPGCGRALRESAMILLDRGFAADHGIDFSVTTHVSDLCVTAMVLGILKYFGIDDPRVDLILDHILERQLPDGGWNCAWSMGSEHYSIHTTISVLEALARCEGARVEGAARAGRECLLRHRMFRSLRTGEPITATITMLSFPFRWYYDILRGLDHFAAALAPRDPRMDEALGILAAKRRRDGSWPVQHRHPGQVHLDMERTGGPSRWNTLRALRVLAAYPEGVTKLAHDA